MKKKEAPAAKRRGVLVDRIREAVTHNLDVFEARFGDSSVCDAKEWIDDVVEAIGRFVISLDAGATTRDLKVELVEALPVIVTDELVNYGVEEEAAEGVIRLLRGIVQTLSRQTGEKRKEGCEELMSWLFRTIRESQTFESIGTFIVDAAEYEEMKRVNTEGTKRLLTVENAGAADSRLSEAYAHEWLCRALRGCVELLKTEMEIKYDEVGEITDFSVQTLGGDVIGVSVTRACGIDFGEAEAQRLLEKKLAGVLKSTENVAECDAWERQVLVCWCDSAAAATHMVSRYQHVSSELKADTYVLLLVAESAQECFYATATSENVMMRGAVSLASVKSVFHKELARRPAHDSEPNVSEASLACRVHEFFRDALGGLPCQVCAFETKTCVWKCKQCDIALCGGCMDKWKKKIR